MGNEKSHKENKSQPTAAPRQKTPDFSEELPVSGSYLQGLQSQFGNQSVKALLQQRGDFSSSNHVVRQSRQGIIQLSALQAQTAGPEETEEEQPFNTGGLGKQGKLPGHGNTGGGAVPSGNTIQRENGSGSVSATVNFTANPPRVISKPGRSIASAHGRPGVAGWTSPKYNMRIPFANPHRATVNVTLDFDMELASEFTGPVLSVLQDHEQGHVKIGKDKGRQHLVTDLKTDLESRSALTPPTIQGALNRAAAQFTSQETTASQAYDSMDYPRMEQAYLGARTPLSTLMGRSTRIAALASALINYNGRIAAANEATAATMADRVVNARDAITEDELSMLQYNPQFKSLVSVARTRTDQYIEARHWDLWIVEFSTLSTETKRKLDMLKIVLGDFTWRTPV